jgi:predicted deacetylase
VLAVSLHCVAPQTLPAARALREHIAAWGVDRVTLLAVPDLHANDPIERSGGTIAWLRARAVAGDEIAVHGHAHLQPRLPRRWGDRVRAGVGSDAEAEYLALAPDERAALLDRDRRLLERLLDREIAGFVAPAWLEPRGFAAELRAAGFRWHETALAIEPLAPRHEATRRRLAPAVAFAAAPGGRLAAGVLGALGGARLLDAAARVSGAPIRVALHPADLASASAMRAAGRAVRSLAARHPSVTCGALAAGAETQRTMVSSTEVSKQAARGSPAST